jgi:hypothetical protein
MNASRSDKSVQQFNRRPLFVPVHVQCEGFRCLAYRDEQGNWIDFASGKPLSGAVRVIEDA